MSAPENVYRPYKGERLGVKPYHLLAFMASILGVLGVLMLVFPKDGIRVTDEFTLHFPTWGEFFAPDTTKTPDLESILAELEGDSSDVMGDPAAMQGQPGQEVEVAEVNVSGRSNKKIQYPDGNLSILYPVFSALEGAATASKPVRVMHYGDSQIEGDRMTSLFRAKLMERFGGSGPGLVPAKPLVNSMSIIQECSETMYRYTQYGQRDKSVTHTRYGAMAIFGRFAPIFPDSMLGKAEYTGWISLGRSASAYANTRVYNTLKMYYGHNRRPFSLKIFVDDVPFWEDSIPAGKGLRTRTWKFASTPGKIMMIMSGEDSPDIYGLSLEGSSGVNVDNISMRGSSGTFFGSLDQSIYRPMIDSLNPTLVLLQYGGNTVPYIKDQSAANGYGNQFKGQIEFLKKLLPKAAFIVIGPSDMATKVGTEYQSYPNLVYVRDALRKAAFDAGAAYFDIYEVMGGHNSMVQWVQAEEPLAGSDYVHFNPRGARVIADAFMKSFLEDYALYQKNKVLP
jgi:lysophospholipase L1-like esterase